MADYFDVSKDVQPDLDRNEQVKRDIAELEAKRDPMRLALTRDIQEAKHINSILQAGHQERANPYYDAIDKLAIGKMVYDELTRTVEQQESVVQKLAGEELKSYGYQSKMVASLSLTYEALKCMIGRGEPFQNELNYMDMELQDADLAPALVALEPLRKSRAALDGVSNDAVLDQSFRLVQDELAVAVLKAQSKAVPVTPTPKRERLTWWEFVKFSLPLVNPRRPEPYHIQDVFNKNKTEVEYKGDQKQFANLPAGETMNPTHPTPSGATPLSATSLLPLESALKGRDLALSWQLTKTLLQEQETMTNNEDNIAVISALRTFSTAVERRVVAETVTGYFDAALAVRRLSFVEAMMEASLKEGPPGGQEEEGLPSSSGEGPQEGGTA